MPSRRLSLLTLVFLTLGSAIASAQSPRAQGGTGIYRGHRVRYQIVNGRMITEGDIGLDHIAQKLPESGTPSGTLDYLQYLWPKVGSVYQIPYTIHAGMVDLTNIGLAISQYNSVFSGIIQWVPQSTETDYVDFNLTASDTSGVGNSYIGRVGGGPQQIWGAGNCTVATLLHEMGHATGLWHEQSRPDRDSYVTVLYGNMINVLQYDSGQQFDDMQTLTLYDWGSLMHYGAWGFTKNGAPTLESIPAGMVLSNNVGYSAGDIDGVRRLYGSAPTLVTIATNPPNLKVIVDGNTITTPQTFNWALHSTHTFDVPADAQTSNSVVYTFGRWNDNGAQSHTITVLPGNGELGFPAAKPAVTVYTANFIQLVPYAMTIYPLGTGTVVPSPAPQSYPGVGGVYVVARQPLTLTAAPNPGQNFYEYINSPYWLPGGLGTNPKTFYVADDGTSINTTAYFSSSPVYVITSNPPDSRFYVNIDNGNYWPAPKSFSLDYDSTWTRGNTHSISVDATQEPWTFNSRYQFGSWSDGGAQTHTITLPSTSTTYTATLNPEYYLGDYANQGCAGTVGVTPSSPTGDSFYPTGTLLSFTATPTTGWTFTEWQNDLTGTGNPLGITMNDELLVTADFSTTATPVTVTSLSPSAAVAGSAKLTLTINGTGFTAGTIVFFNNLYHASTLISSNKITIALTPADLATPGGKQVFVENFPSGASCAAYQALPFNVASSPIVKPSVLALVFTPQVVATTSAAKTVTLMNTSSSAVSMNPVAVSGAFAITTNTCGATLGAGSSCTVGLTFTPTVPGATTGSLTVSDGAPDSPQTVALTGTGTLPLTITPAALAFGTAAVGTTSASKTVTLTNNESTMLSFSFAASGNYAISAGGTTCGASLASKATCNLAVTFTPTANGAINGAVSITDGTSFTPQLVALSGTGSGGAVAPLTFTPATLTFAAQAVGTISTGKTVTVKNTSASTLTLSAIASSGDFAEVGSGTTPCAASLALNAGASCTMSVTFSPAFGAAGAINGAVVVSDNATVGRQIFDVKGTAALPLTFSPASLTFPAQNVATSSAPQTVTITNNLAGSVTLAIAGSGEFAAVPGGLTPCGASLAGHAKCTFSVTFAPSAVGTRGSAATVTDSANPSLQSVNVIGTGQ